MDQVIYQIAVDRFSGESLDYSVEYSVNDLCSKFLGGNLKGISNRMNYIAELGIDALLLTPLFKGESYHGYHIVDFRQIDPRFGDEEDLVNLIEMAHKSEISVYLDFVITHTHMNHPWFQDSLKHKQKSRYYNDYLFLESGDYLGFLGDSQENLGLRELPRTNTESEFFKKYILDTINWYIKKFRIDGIRLDWTRGIHESFFHDFRERLKLKNPDFFVFGENWTDDNGIGSYVGKLDGELDFFINALLRSSFSDTKPDSQRLDELIMEHYSMLPRGYICPVFLSNPDQKRFRNLPNIDIGRMREAYALLFSLPAPVIIYYGEEIGLPQYHVDFHDSFKGDYSRVPMRWKFNVENTEILSFFKSLIERKKHS